MQIIEAWFGIICASRSEIALWAFFMVKKLFDFYRQSLTKKHKNAIVGIGRMGKKIALVISWFAITPIVILTFSILIYQHNKIYSLSKVGPQITPQIAIEPNSVSAQVLGVQIDDLRSHYVANFLKKTPLEPYANTIVETSDKYDLDYRLVPAIAMKESGGGRAAPTGSYNAWGFENGATRFTSWESAIEIVAKTLKERYIAKGLTTPEEIMPVYAPPQIFTGGKWAQDINFFFSKMESL